MQASAFLKDGIDVLGSTLLKCAPPLPLLFCAQKMCQGIVLGIRLLEYADR